MAQQFDVTVIGEGGGYEQVIRVSANSQDQARAAAVAIANAQAQAQGKQTNFKARHIVSVYK